MEYEILLLPASLHDVIYLTILAITFDLADRRRSYHKIICWFVALLFLMQSLLQIFDIRPPGNTGQYDLYFDNIVNGIFLMAFITSLSFMIRAKIIRLDYRIVFFYALMVLFLAFNALLTFSAIRGLMNDYAMAYDFVYYAILYIAVISSSRTVSGFIRDRFTGFSPLLRDRRNHLY